ncbi:Uncharacterized protein FKW44_019234, partial [Caligus rogercresseyi]
MSTGIIVTSTTNNSIHNNIRGRRSRSESTSNSISLAKSRFENPRSHAAAGTKSPFTSILNRHSDETPAPPPPPSSHSLRRRSPSPVITGVVTRAKGRFEGNSSSSHRS